MRGTKRDETATAEEAIATENAYAQMRRRAEAVVLHGGPAAKSKCICTWCKKMLEDGDEPISHGICPDCRKKHLNVG